MGNDSCKCDICFTNEETNLSRSSIITPNTSSKLNHSFISQNNSGFNYTKNNKLLSNINILNNTTYDITNRNKTINNEKNEISENKNINNEIDNDNPKTTCIEKLSNINKNTILKTKNQTNENDKKDNKVITHNNYMLILEKNKLMNSGNHNAGNIRKKNEIYKSFLSQSTKRLNESSLNSVKKKQTVEEYK